MLTTKIFSISKIVCATLVLLMAGCVTPHAGEPSAYLCCNMQSDQNGWITDINYKESHKFMLPVGTPLRVGDFGKNRVNFETTDSSTRVKNFQLGNDYSRNLDLAQFSQRYFVKTDPRARIASFPEPIRQAIADSKIMHGMTKEQVLMSIGYPPSNYTRTLNEPWQYWYWTRSPFTLHWDKDGKIVNIETDRHTFSQVAVSSK